MGSAASDPAYLTKLLQDAVLDQNIQAFYPPGSLEPLAQHLARSNAIPAVAQLLGLHVEVALDLARLALFDVVLFLDDSGSMSAFCPATSFRRLAR